MKNLGESELVICYKQITKAISWRFPNYAINLLKIVKIMFKE